MYAQLTTHQNLFRTFRDLKFWLFCFSAVIVVMRKKAAETKQKVLLNTHRGVFAGA